MNLFLVRSNEEEGNIFRWASVYTLGGVSMQSCGKILARINVLGDGEFNGQICHNATTT